MTSNGDSLPQKMSDVLSGLRFLFHVWAQNRALDRNPQFQSIIHDTIDLLNFSADKVCEGLSESDRQRYCKSLEELAEFLAGKADHSETVVKINYIVTHFCPI